MSVCCDTKVPASALEIDTEDFARMCKALGYAARVQLLKNLAEYGACYFGSLTDVLPLAPSTVSQHVTILKRVGLVLGSSDEQRVCYCVNPDRLSAHAFVACKNRKALKHNCEPFIS